MEHATREDTQGIGIVGGSPRKRNLLNAHNSSNGYMRPNTLGAARRARALSDTLVTRADGQQYWLNVHKRTARANARKHANSIIGTPLDYVVNAQRAPRHSLTTIASFLLARGWDTASITAILNVHRARPDYGTTVEVVMGDTWQKH